MLERGTIRRRGGPLFLRECMLPKEGRGDEGGFARGRNYENHHRQEELIL